MKKKIKVNFSGMFWRQFAVTAGMVMLTMVLLGLSFFAVTYSYTLNTKRTEMISRAEIIASLSSDFLVNGSKENISESFSTIAEVSSRMTNVKFLICDQKGTVLVTTDETLDGENLKISEETIEEILNNEKPVLKRTSLGNLYDQKEAVVAVPIYNRGSKVGVVFAVNDMTELVQIWTSFLSIYGFTGAVVLILAIMIAYVASGREIRPIREMVNATRMYGEGNFDVRMKTNSDYSEEINELSNSFNQMADSLQETERQRRDFIANASHELKTPMTTIAGYTDGILDGTIPPEKERQYLQIISDESRRLSRLVRRMLDLSRLQSMELNEEKFDICESVRIAVLSLEKKVTDRGLKVEIELPDEPVICVGDKELITQVIYNLAENATKYASANTSVYFGVGKTEEKAVVTVCNEGKDIPPEEIPMIFERFHKSDKSRSVDKDGYGLGLYVVKTIIDRHKEKIICDSKNGKTKFVFTLQLGKRETYGRKQ